MKIICIFPCKAIWSISLPRIVKKAWFSILLTFLQFSKKYLRFTVRSSKSPKNDLYVPKALKHLMLNPKLLKKNVSWTNFWLSKNCRLECLKLVCLLSLFWQQEEGQLIFADVLYQMVDLCDDNDDLLSGV